MLKERRYFVLYVVLGSIVGGFLGAAILPSGKETIVITGLASLITFGTGNLPGTALGALVGGGFGLMGLALHTQKRTRIEQNQQGDSFKGSTLQLRGEQLEITKKWLRTGDVKVHREIIIEKKTIVVPITREDLVIEKFVYAENVLKPLETLRVPLRDENVEIFKRPVLLGEVSIYKHRFQETEQINEILRKEQVHVETEGECNLLQND